ncbi:PDGLE domain-containing protein [Phycicoccus sp. Soil803]|uniref:PDGLE domain-containing protein n=1 Tax=Phycicoccus sp. Soil803 TaxID=1736415 RepID=UPI000A89BAB1|nr:PDGLE domain-containing protein [Phycicoccus sp. Soil803]
MTAAAPRPRVSTRRLMAVGILVCLFLAGVVSYYASSHPDGLEFVAKEQGFAGSAAPHASDGSPFAGYATRGIDDARVSGGVAGLVGAALVFVIAGGLFVAVRRRDRATSDDVTSAGATSDAGVSVGADGGRPERDGA